MSKRQAKRRQARKTFVVAALSILSSFSIVMGMGIILVKSPAQKGSLYASIAAEYQQTLQDDILDPAAQAVLLRETASLIKQALQENPYHSDLWKKYAYILAQQSQHQYAQQARDIALSLGAENFSPVTAVSSMYPQRNFALSDTYSESLSSGFTPTKIMMR